MSQGYYLFGHLSSTAGDELEDEDKESVSYSPTGLTIEYSMFMLVFYIS